MGKWSPSPIDSSVKCQYYGFLNVGSESSIQYVILFFEGGIASMSKNIKWS